MHGLVSTRRGKRESERDRREEGERMTEVEGEGDVVEGACE